MLQIIALLSVLAAEPTAVKLTVTPDKPAKCRLVKVVADTEKVPLWRVDGPVSDLEAEGKVLRFVAAGPGTVTVRCYTVAGETVAEGVLAVVIDAPPEPAPPPRPDPTDPLAKDLVALYAADASPTKTADAKQLAALYREAVKFAASTDVGTIGELATRVRTAGGTLVPATSLVPLRKRIAEELGRSFAIDGPLTSESRLAAAAVFGRIAAALETLK